MFASKAVVETQTTVRSIVSLRRLMAEESNLARVLLREYFRYFCLAFPFSNEREEEAVYDQYLNDPEFPWDTSVLLENGKIIGGAQYQHLAVGDDSVIFAEHFWLRGAKRWMMFELETGFRSPDRFSMLGRHLEEVARAKNAAAIIWECNDPRLMTTFQMRVDKKAGLSTERRNRLWNAYGKVLDIYYAQPRLSAEETAVEFLMLCMRGVRPGFQMTGKFYRTLFHNFVLTFNDDPSTDETYNQVMELSMEYGDDDVIPLIPFSQARSFFAKKKLAA